MSLLSHFHQEEAGVHVQGEEGEGRQEPLLPEGQSHGFPSSLSFPHYSALPCPPPLLPLSLSFPPLRTVEMVDALARSDRSAHLAIHVHTLLVLEKGGGCCCCGGGGCVVVLYVGRAVMLWIWEAWALLSLCEQRKAWRKAITYKSTPELYTLGTVSVLCGRREGTRG